MAVDNNFSTNWQLEVDLIFLKNIGLAVRNINSLCLVAVADYCRL